MSLENQALSAQLLNAYRIDVPADEALIPIAGPFIYGVRCQEGRKELQRRTNDWKILEEYDFQVSMRKVGLFLENIAVVGALMYGAIKLLS